VGRQTGKGLRRCRGHELWTLAASENNDDDDDDDDDDD